jgi:hypothetical protein
MNEFKHLEVLEVTAEGAANISQVIKDNAPFVGYTTDKKVVYTTL